MFKLVKIKRLANVKNDRRSPLDLCANELLKCAARLDRLAINKDNDNEAQRLSNLAQECRVLRMWVREESQRK